MRHSVVWKREPTYVMNEVRASVCKPSARSALSRYLGISPMDITTELEGLILGWAGSNDSKCLVGEEGRELGGVALGAIEEIVLNHRCQSLVLARHPTGV